jgi:hypothetical protein
MTLSAGAMAPSATSRVSYAHGLELAPARNGDERSSLVLIERQSAPTPVVRIDGRLATWSAAIASNA